MVKLAIRILMAIGLVVALAACAGDDDASTETPAEDGEETAAAEAPEDEAPEDEAPEDGAATEDGAPTEEGDAAPADGGGEELVDEWYAAAQDEPRLVWYSSHTPTRNDAVVAAFQERYPDVDIEHLRLPTGSLVARYAEERTAEVINADIISMADPNFVDEGFEQGWFEQFDQSEIPALADLPERWFNEGSATTSIALLGIGYNTELVGDTPPETWEDLLDEQYRGEMLFGDPRNVPSYMALMRILRDEYGDEYLESLAAQDLVTVDSVVPASEQLGAGEVALVVPNIRDITENAKDTGAPVEIAVPALTTGNEFETLLSTEADSPNAARLLYNFLFTEEGQIAYNGTNSASPYGALGDTDPLPDDYRDPAIRELDEHRDEILALLGLS